MAITNGYCDLDQLAAKMGFDDDKKTRHQTLMEDSITQASRFIDTYTNRFFYNKVITDEIIDVNGISENGFFFSPNCNVIVCPASILNVTSLTEAGVSLTEQTDYAGAGEYMLKKSLGYLIKVDGTWSTGNLAVKLAGSFGSTIVLPDIRQACLIIAKTYTELGNKVVTDSSGEAEGILEGVIPDFVFDLLKKHKRPIL